MALSTCKLTSSLPFRPARLRFRLFSASASPRTPWMQNWSPLDPAAPPSPKKPPKQTGPAVSTSIERIVHRLRNLGVDGEEEEGEEEDGVSRNENASFENELDGNEKLGDLLERSWSRPDQLALSISNQTHVLPWERDQYKYSSNLGSSESKKQKRATAPTMAELTIEDGELRRLRTVGMHLRERISVAKAGVTRDIVEKIHEGWRKNELVRLKFHESLAHDMKTAHELVERRTGGLVIWRSGSVMVVYRGPHFSLSSSPTPPSLLSPKNTKNNNNNILIPDLSTPPQPQSATSPPQNPNFTSSYVETLTEEEVEFNEMLDRLGPRFSDWWGTGILPVDADLLEETIEGYKTPFRLLPTGMRSRLTNAEMTELRHVARKLPCHFALEIYLANAKWQSSFLAMRLNSVSHLSTRQPQPYASWQEPNNNVLLDDLGPRFEDLLDEVIEGYKTPFRLLPTSMRSRLTNAEMTELRHVARKLPCHFALGRNRKHQGLAQAILKLWEKSLLVKIAIKRGVQNTNNKLMAEELKRLTGGTLLQRNKFYIVIYRGKDFLPPAVASVLAERQELADDVQSVEEKTRVQSLINGELNDENNNIINNNINNNNVNKDDEIEAPVGTLEEFRQAMAQWGREISNEEREEMREKASRGEKDRLVKKIDHKIYIAQLKKERAEKLLAKVEAGMVPVGPSDDREMITSEERSVFRRIGLRMKSYLPMGIRGVFDGVIENMHLHWKHREVVKLISKQKKLPYVEDTARLLEYESGGILVSIERVPKGFALIYYRGKNYKRPISIRPRNLLSKNKALKRAVAMQRHEALSQHILDLESTIRRMKSELGIDEDDEEESDSSSENMSNTSNIYDESEDDEDFSESEEDDFMESDEDENEDDISEYESN